MSTHPTMRGLYRALAQVVLDPGVWWPAEDHFEILVGAILTQNTAWTSVEKALDNLRKAHLLAPERLLDSDPAYLGELIRPAGYWRTKTGYLQAISGWYLTYSTNTGAEGPHTDQWDDGKLRASLLAVRGVGEETADDILLYAYHRPVFIYDTYARRLLSAAGWGNFSTYSSARGTCDDQIQAEGFTVEEYAHLHGLIVQAGKDARANGGWDIYWPQVLQLAVEADTPVR